MAVNNYYRIEIGMLSYEPYPYSSSCPVMDYTFYEGMAEADLLTILLEQNPSGYGIEEGDLVKLYEGATKVAAIQTFQGIVRQQSETEAGDLEVLCVDKQDNLTGALLDRLIYANLRERHLLAIEDLYPTLLYPGAVLPDTDWHRPLRRVLLLSGITEAIQTGYGTDWQDRKETLGDPPVDYISISYNGVDRTGYKVAFNFRPPSIEGRIHSLKVYGYFQSPDVTPPAGTATFQVIRLADPLGVVVDETPPANKIVWEGDIDLSLLGAWGWKVFPLEIVGSVVLDPDDTYQVVIIAPETGRYDIRISVVELSPAGYDFPTFGVHVKDTVDHWVHTMDHGAMMGWRILDVVCECVEGRDYSIQNISGIDYIVFDKQLVPDFIGTSLNTLDVSYSRGTVDADDIYEQLFQSAGLDYLDSLAGTLPVLDCHGATVREVLNTVMGQLGHMMKLSRSDWKPHIYTLPSSSVLSVDKGESGVAARNIIVQHKLVRDKLNIYSSTRVYAEAIDEQPIAWNLSNTYKTDMNNPADAGATMRPGYWSENRIERSYMSLQDIKELLELEEEKRLYESWKGSIELDGQLHTLRPGDIITVRDDSIGLDTDLRIMEINRGRYTTRLTLERYPDDVNTRLSQIDRRLNILERTSIPDALDRRYALDVLSTILGYPDNTYIYQDLNQWLAMSYARLEDADGNPVTRWQRALDQITFDDPQARWAVWHFPSSLENVRMAQAYTRLHVVSEPEMDDPSWDFVVSITQPRDPKDTGLGLIVGLKATEAA